MVAVSKRNKSLGRSLALWWNGFSHSTCLLGIRNGSSSSCSLPFTVSADRFCDIAPRASGSLGVEIGTWEGWNRRCGGNRAEFTLPFPFPEHRAVMEAAFVYGTIHQFVLTTEAALLKATRYIQTHPHHGELLPCPVCLTPGISDSQINSGMALGCCAKGGQSDLFCRSCWVCSWPGSSFGVCDCTGWDFTGEEPSVSFPWLMDPTSAMGFQES